MQLLAALGFSSFALALILTPIFRILFVRLNLVDIPDQVRKMHDRPVPRLGGIPLILSYFGALLYFFLAFPQGKSFLQVHGNIFWCIAPGAGIVFLIGLFDDLMNLKPWQKLAGQVAASIVACAGGVHIGNIGGVMTDAWWTWPLTVAWLVGCTNAFNLIDGVDGLAAGVGAVAASTAIVAAIINHNYELAIVTIPLAGALLGFLNYNFNPASIFLGDSGSLPIGFLLGCYGIVWSQKSATVFGMAAPIMALSLPLLDTFVSIVRRLLRRQPIFSADRGHIHHRLLARGFKPRDVALILYGVCGVGAVLSLLQCVLYRHVGGLIVVLSCLFAVLGVRLLNYAEFSAVQKLILGGDFLRMMEYEIDLHDLKTMLEVSKDMEGAWPAVGKICEKLGFDFVGLRVNGRDFATNFRKSDALKSWYFDVRFQDDVSLQLRGSLAGSQKVPLMALIGVFQDRFRAMGETEAGAATIARKFPAPKTDLAYAAQEAAQAPEAV